MTEIGGWGVGRSFVLHPRHVSAVDETRLCSLPGHFNPHFCFSIRWRDARVLQRQPAANPAEVHDLAAAATPTLPGLLQVHVVYYRSVLISLNMQA